VGLLLLLPLPLLLLLWYLWHLVPPLLLLHRQHWQQYELLVAAVPLAGSVVLVRPQGPPTAAAPPSSQT
jgi:hypothetical protein